MNQSVDTPAFVIIAGPNGSGKSSVYENTHLEAFGRAVWIINPDLLTARISRVEKRETAQSNIEAVTRIEAWLDASMEVHQTIGVETVLSTPKYRRLVTKCKEFGFSFWFIYVVLDSPDRNVERVRLRVKKGGHAVPEHKIRERHRRSLAQFPWFLDQADQAWIYDNSGANPVLIAAKADGVVTMKAGMLAEIADGIRSIETR